MIVSHEYKAGPIKLGQILDTRATAQAKPPLANAFVNLRTYEVEHPLVKFGVGGQKSPSNYHNLDINAMIN